MTLPKPPQRTTPGFAFSVLDRALWEAFARRAFGPGERQQVIDFFGRVECVYCGSDDVSRWDHLVAVTKGGDTVPGNMVPACRPCDDSKRDLPFDRWMFSRHPASPRSRGVPLEELEQRARRVRAYVQAFGYAPVHREDRLDPDLRERLRQVLDALAALRTEVDDLVATYRAGRHGP